MTLFYLLTILFIFALSVESLSFAEMALQNLADEAGLMLGDPRGYTTLQFTSDFLASRIAFEDQTVIAAILVARFSQAMNRNGIKHAEEELFSPSHVVAVSTYLATVFSEEYPRPPRGYRTCEFNRMIRAFLLTISHETHVGHDEFNVVWDTMQACQEKGHPAPRSFYLFPHCSLDSLR
jgi:hypothetical protein